jgi:hypothetical protein
MQDDTLLLFKYRIEYKNQKDENGNTFLHFAIDTVRIPENMIQKMSIDEYDSQSTWYLASAVISGVLILIIYVAGSNFEDTY